METKEKKKAIDVVIDAFLKRVETTGEMPWQNPHLFGAPINWVSKKMYRGINRVILPSGEYMTSKQLNDYNEQHGTDYRFQKGIMWYPVVFYTKKTYYVKKEDYDSYLNGESPVEGKSYSNGKSACYCRDGVLVYDSMILRYSSVADIRHFKDSSGNSFPSRIEGGELVVTYEEPQSVIDAYIQSSGVGYEEFDDGVSYYSPSRDLVHVNQKYKTNESRYTTIFHELAHSTGAVNRLRREGVLSTHSFGSESYAVEECIAEIAASLLAHETGISTFVTSGTESYDNSAVYVSHWSQRIKDWGTRFVSICKQAELAYIYILGVDGESQLSGKEGKEV